MVVERFWRVRGDEVELTEQGFLRDPDLVHASQSRNSNAQRLKHFIEQRCLVLLGEPGAGKSTALDAPSELAPRAIPTVSIDLASFGSEDRLVTQVTSHPTVEAWRTGVGELCLVLDSVDEARTRIPHLGMVLAEILAGLPHDRLFLRLACRTAEWPRGLEDRLSSVFGALVVCEVLPLRRKDAEAIAAEFCDAHQLLAATDRAGIGSLVSRPLTLRFLAHAFSRKGVLPGPGVGLFEAGLRSLCEEQNHDRRDSGLVGALTVEQRMNVASLIAALCTFGCKRSIFTGATTDASEDDITLEELLVNSSAPFKSQSYPLTKESILETLRTGLFSGRGRQQLGWAHATFADFLAARWVVKNLSYFQARPLFLAPDGKCWPQTRSPAAWAVSLDPARFVDLAEADPAALAVDVELNSDTLRAALVDALFSIASTVSGPRWTRSYTTLKHQGIVDQVRPKLEDPDPDIRRLAIELADDCACSQLSEELVRIVRDISAATADRISAGYALSRLDPPDRVAGLRDMVLDPSLGGEDPDDEIKGVALLASWPHAVANQEVFCLVTPRKKTSLFGAYYGFLERFRGTIGDEDVRDGLDWLVKNLSAAAADPVLGGLANRVLMLASSTAYDAQVIESLARIAIVRGRQFQPVLFQDLHHRLPSEDLFASDELRHLVTLAILRDPVMQTEPKVITLTRWHQNLVRKSDLPWLSNVYESSEPALRTALGNLFSLTFDKSDLHHCNFIRSISVESQLFKDVVGSPEAEDLRQGWNSYHPVKHTESVEPDWVPEGIEEYLDAFDAGDPTGFWQALRLASVSPGSKFYGPDWDPDVTAMERWPTLPSRLQTRVVRAAEHYLRTCPCEPPEWASEPSVVHLPVFGGYRAMIILLRVAPDRLRGLPSNAWVEWAPLLGALSTAFINGATWDDKLALFTIAGAQVRPAARDAMLARVHAVVPTGEAPHILNEARLLWDERVASSFYDVASSAGGDLLHELVESMSENDFDLLRPLLTEWLETPQDDARLRIAVALLVANDLERCWEILVPTLERDLVWTQEVIGDMLGVRGHNDERITSSMTAASVYVWLRRNFPPELDPRCDDAHFVGPREELARWRDRILSQLIETGTGDSVAAVRSIVDAFPQDRWLHRSHANAQASLRRNQWPNVSPSELIRMSIDHRSVLVHSPGVLVDVLTRVLDEVQDRLTGATPEAHYLWDSFAGRPKSEDEVSDYLRNELDRALADRAMVVNREVQVRRNRPTGVGERTDLLIDSVGDSPGHAGISVPVEVKGAWNRELLTAMTDQLADRYMRDLSATHGLYIVVWPDLASWTDRADNRRAVQAALDRGDVEKKLTAQATSLSSQGLSVRVVHLEVSYRRSGT